MGMFSQELRQRLFYGFSLGILTILILNEGGILLLIATMWVAASGLREFYRLVRAEGGRTFDLVGYPLAAIMIIIAFSVESSQDFTYESIGLLSTVYILLVSTANIVRAVQKKPLYKISEISITFFGIFLTAGLLSYVFKLHPLGSFLFPEKGNYLIFVPMIGAWAYDSAAFFSGKYFGKNNYLSYVSKKTWEGTLGGLLGSSFGMCFFAYLSGMGNGDNLFYWWLIGLILGFVAQLGDLAFSVLKREKFMKDYGNSIPGHGGILDRMDSFLFVLPVSYYLIKMFFNG